MKELRLLLALGEIAPRYAEEAANAKPRRRWTRALAAVACLALVVGAAGMFIDRLGFFRAGCSAWPGDFVEGRYYYTVQHSGLYCWDGETSEKVLGAFWYEGRLVNGHGIYYKRGRSLYVKAHDTGKTQKLYTAPLFGCSHIGFSFYGDDVVVRIYNKWKEYASEVLIDGKTGDVLEAVTPRIPYSDLYDNLAWSDTHLKVGEREIELVHLSDGDGVVLMENGRSILPEGVESVSQYVYTYYDQLLFRVSEEWPDRSTVFLLRPDGDDRLVELPTYTCSAAVGDYVYWDGDSDSDSVEDAVWCMDTRTGESWRLENDVDMEFYELSTDGVHLFSCVPWDDYQALWQIQYDADQRPVALTLLDEDITD